MAAILGLEDAQVEELCAAIEGKLAWANYQPQGQIVIAGEKAAAETANESLQKGGA